MFKAIGVLLGLVAVAWVLVNSGKPAPPPPKYAMPAVVGMENRAAESAIRSAIPGAAVIEFDDSGDYEAEHQCLWRLPSGETANHLNGGHIVHSAEYAAGTELNAGESIDIRVLQPGDAVCVPFDTPAGQPGSSDGSFPNVDLPNIDVDKPYLCRHTRWC